MVRIIIFPLKYLTDQHLISEYNEILMLLGHVKKNPDIGIENLPKEYRGEGNTLFFRNKFNCLKKRFNKIKREMKRRGFRPKEDFDLTRFHKNLRKNWKPCKKDKEKIKNRLKEKIRLKPDYYTYYEEKRPRRFYEGLLEKTK